MTLNLSFPTCLVCERDIGQARDDADLDQLDENGGRTCMWFDHTLPAARYRDRIAPQLCDHCWSGYRNYMHDWRARRRFGCCPPFRAIYLWAWVADQLAKHAQRLTPGYARKAAAGRDAMVRWR